MDYAASQDLVDRFGERELVQLTDRVNVPPSAIDATVVGRAIADATALADGYLGKVYKLPIMAPPPVLTKITCDVALYYLHGDRAEKDGPVERAYKEAVAWLKDVSRGLVQIDAGGDVPPQAGGGSVRATPSTRVFSRDSLRGA